MQLVNPFQTVLSLYPDLQERSAETFLRVLQGSLYKIHEIDPFMTGVFQPRVAPNKNLPFDDVVPQNCAVPMKLRLTQ